MLKLYTVSRRKLDEIHEIPFKDEEDLQSFVAKNPQLLGGKIEIIAQKMPVEGGEIDIVAVDKAKSEPKLLLVELKIGADRKIIGQVLDYADRISLDPERIRQEDPSLTNEAIKNPRLVIVASDVPDQLVNLTRYVQTFEWDVIELHRFANKRGTFAIINRRRPVKGEPEEPTWEMYRVVFGYEEADIVAGKKLLGYLQTLCARYDWDLHLKQTTDYRPAFGEWSFDWWGKRGRREDAFGIGPMGKEDRGWLLFFRLPNKPSEYNAPLGDQGTEWMADGNYFFIYLTGVSRGLRKCVESNVPLFQRAYKYAVKRGNR